MALDFDGERMIKKMEEKQPEHPQQPLCACSTFSCNKLWLFIYTLLYVVVGSGLLLLGLWIEFQEKDYRALNTSLFLPAMIMMGVGLVIIINSLIGIAGVLKESTCLCRVFLGFTVLAFGAQVAIGVLAFIYRQDIPGLMSENFMFLVREYNDNNFYKSSLDNVQAQFHCCGLDSYMDYEENAYFQCNSDTPQKCGVPWTCCKPDAPDSSLRIDCGYQIRWNASMPVEKIHTMGCTDVFLTWLSSRLDLVGIVGLGTATPQITSNQNTNDDNVTAYQRHVKYIIGILLAYFFIRHVREMTMWYRVGA